MIIYHKNCVDGFVSAFITAIATGITEDKYLYPNSYGEANPWIAIEEAVNDIYIVDMCFDSNTLKDICEIAYPSNVTVIDHHTGNFPAEDKTRDIENLITVFADTQPSGAVLCYTHFHKQISPLYRKVLKKIAEYVSDYDTWTHSLAGSKEFHYYLKSIPFRFDDYMNKCVYEILDNSFESVIKEGKSILQYQEKVLINPLVKQVTNIAVHNYDISLINAPLDIASILGHKIATKYNRIGVIYSISGSNVYVSVRSNDKTAKPFAELFNGGGHPNAAGFTLSLNRFVSIFLVKGRR